MSSCLQSQGCHLVPFSYFLSFFCVVLLLFLSCHSLLAVHFPDFFPENYPKIFVKRWALFSRNFSQHFSLRGGFLCVWLLLSSYEMIAGRWLVHIAAVWH